MLVRATRRMCSISYLLAVSRYLYTVLYGNADGVAHCSVLGAACLHTV